MFSDESKVLLGGFYNIGKGALNHMHIPKYHGPLPVGFLCADRAHEILFCAVAAKCTNWTRNGSTRTPRTCATCTTLTPWRWSMY